MIYIAGPFRGADPWQVAENVRRAERVAVWCAQHGLHFLCPHTMCSNFDQLSGVTDQFWIDMTLEMLRRSDLVLLVEGWRSSLGTQGEIEYARRTSKRIYEFDQLEKFAEKVAEILIDSGRLVGRERHDMCCRCAELGETGEL
jgi:nucleoside 2-deoxyribosyltransferase